jgi:hypothetical protein
MQTGAEVKATRAALAATLSELIGRYEQGRPFSAWERHCLAQAMKSLRVGNYEQAHQQVSEAVTPPNPLPTFRFPIPVTVDELRKALGTIGG